MQVAAKLHFATLDRILGFLSSMLLLMKDNITCSLSLYMKAKDGEAIGALKGHPLLNFLLSEGCRRSHLKLLDIAEGCTYKELWTCLSNELSRTLPKSELSWIPLSVVNGIWIGPLCCATVLPLTIASCQVCKVLLIAEGCLILGHSGSSWFQSAFFHTFRLLSMTKFFAWLSCQSLVTRF